MIENEFDIQFYMPCDTAVVGLLHLHPSLGAQLRSRDELSVDRMEAGGAVPFREYLDGFGNRCTRFVAPAGPLRLIGKSVVEMPEVQDRQGWEAEQQGIDDLPNEVLQFLLSSRYCEVDRFSAIANDLFGQYARGWELAAAIRDWVHVKVRFDYAKARPTKTAMDVYTEREGVCRDYQHLAVTLSRAMNIPAR